MRLAKRTPKKEGYFTAFWKKDQNNKNIPYTNEDLGDELVIVVIDNDKSGLFIISNEEDISRKILSTKDNNGKMSMRFYPPLVHKFKYNGSSNTKLAIEIF